MSGTPGSRPTRAEADARLDRLRVDARRPGYRFLAGSRLAGATLTRWQTAQQAVAQAQAILDRRRAGDVAELDNLLVGPAVTLDSIDVPLARRGLTGPATVVTRVSVAELVATHQLANSLLWTSPCDLTAATRALAAYQRLITERESNR